MLLAILSVLFGLILLVWSADRFVDGSAAAASHFGMPPLLIGMVVIGFGTSAPEMAVSAFSAFRGSPGIALGNAYGSNIMNIALILGLTALINPITVQSQVLKRELPVLTVVTGLAAYQLLDSELTRIEALTLLSLFGLLMAWTIRQGLRKETDTFGSEMAHEIDKKTIPIRKALLWFLIGLALLIISSRMLVWGAVEIAHGLRVNDLIIGLTIVSIGTSLPELASSLIAARKGEHDLALGNILGSNLFNTMAVVGIAGTIRPMSVNQEVFSRDIIVMAALTISLFFIGYGFRRQGRINRWEGGILLSSYIVYASYLIRSVLQ